jgi:hypothetical protein
MNKFSTNASMIISFKLEEIVKNMQKMALTPTERAITTEEYGRKSNALNLCTMSINTSCETGIEVKESTAV